MDTAGIGVWTWNVEANRVHGDKVIAEYFGLPEREAKSGVPVERCLQAIHPNDRRRVTQSIELALKRGSDFHEVYRVFTRHLGQRTIEAHGQCYLDGKGRPSVYPGFICDLAAVQTDGEDEIVAHLQVAQKLARRRRENMVDYLIEMALLECRQKDGGAGRLRRRTT